MNNICEEYDVPEASEKIGITKQAGYIWIKRWNEDGYEDLKPRFAGGRPSKLTDQEKSDLKELLKKRDDCTTKEAIKLIKKEFNVEYSLKKVIIILKGLD